MTNTTIAHLSDLHINPKYYPERSDMLHETLRQCEQRNVDHLIITGDLSHLGQAEELEHCAAILREHGFWDSSRLTVTIGNHDVFGGPYYAEDVLTFPGICRETGYDAKVKIFRDIFAPSFETSLHVPGENVFPFVKLIGDIALVGLNTVARWSALKNPLGSNGEVDEQQFERLERILNDSRMQGRRIFILTHHHFNAPRFVPTCSVMGKLWQRIEAQTLKLWNRKRLLELLQVHGVEKILHGHVHEHTEYREGGVSCLNAGASMLPAANEERNYHLIGAPVAGNARHAQAVRPQHVFRPPMQHFTPISVTTVTERLAV